MANGFSPWDTTVLQIGLGLGHGLQSTARFRAGDWRVEVRSQDGVLLHEERFSVR